MDKEATRAMIEAIREREFDRIAEIAEENGITSVLSESIDLKDFFCTITKLNEARKESKANHD